MRFCLDNTDKGTESEEEFWDETMIPSTSQRVKNYACSFLRKTKFFFSKLIAAEK